MKSPDYVSRTGSLEEMTVVADALVERGYVLLADNDDPKKKLGPKQFRRWEIEGQSGPVVILLWLEGHF